MRLEGKNLQEQTKLLKSLVKQVNYDANQGILEIVLQNDKSCKFSLKLDELKHIPPHKKEIEVTKEPVVRQNLIFAHQIADVMKEKDCSLHQISKWTGMPHPRLCQIASMINVSPKIQEEILFSSDKRLYRIPEYRLRDILSETCWNKQQEIWNDLLKSSDRQA
jgi:hypothetical protein